MPRLSKLSRSIKGKLQNLFRSSDEIAALREQRIAGETESLIHASENAKAREAELQREELAKTPEGQAQLEAEARAKHKQNRREYSKIVRGRHGRRKLDRNALGKSFKGLSLTPQSASS